MTKRISRKALALAAVGVLASPAFAQVANAQIITKTIAVTLRAVGPVPAGVTGANVTVSCQNTTNNPGAITSAFALTPGQTANLNNFNLSPVAPAGSGPGSSCTVTVTNAGSANTGKGAITISIGGATSTSGAGGTAGAGFSTGGALNSGGALTLTSNTVAVFDSTDVQITMSYPQITVKKVVVGDEATAGFAYPMSIACANPTDVRFISPANGLEGGSVTIPVTTGTAAVAAQKAFVASASPATFTFTWTVPPSTTVVSGVGTSAATVIPAGALAGTQTPLTAASTVPTGYAAGDLVVPGGGYVTVTLVNGAGVLTPALGVNTYRIYDALTTGALPANTATQINLLGTFANINPVVGLVTVPSAAFSVAAAGGYPAATYVGTATAVPAGLSTTQNLSTLLQAALQTLPAIGGSAGTSTASTVTVYPFNTNPVPAGGILGNWANLSTGTPLSLYSQVLAQILKEAVGGTVAPNTAGGFTGSFTLKGGESRSLSFNEFPNLTAGSKCEVWETNSGGASVTAFSSTSGTAAPLAGLNNANGRFQSSLTAMNETITVTNSFLGDMIISKVVTGDPKTNIATYEISVACNRGGPKDTFLIKDRQSKVYSGIAAGTDCLITETKSDGAVASYKDNSGDNTTDGRVSIKRRPIGGCGDVLAVTGAPTAAVPGGPAPTSTFNECWASVIITNDYNPPATTAAPAAPAAAAPATAAPATAAPAVAPAPAVAVDATPTFAG